MSFFEVKCPMCKGSLWIDRSSGKVVDHKSPDMQKVEFEDFLKSREDDSKWDGKMQKAKEESEKRKAELNEMFKKAKDDPDSIEGDYISPFAGE